MFRRVALIVAILILVSSMSFANTSGCNNWYCWAIDDNSDACFSPSPDGGVGDLQACTTVRQCNSGGDCLTYCRASYCYYV